MKHFELTNEAIGLVAPPDQFNNNRPGDIFFANEARFTASTYSEALTAYTVGWKDPENIDAILQIVAPEVSVSRRFEWKKATNAEAFLSETDDIRAIGSPFKFVEYKGESVNDKTLNKGLGIRVDHDDVVGDNWRQEKTDMLLQRLQRNDLRRALAAIAAAATASTSVWNKDTNPDKDLRDLARGAKNTTGIRPNIALFADDAWDLRADAYEEKNTPAGGRAADMGPEQVAAKVGLERILKIGAIYQSTLTAKATVQTALTVLMYYARQGLSKDDPSNVKRFVTPSTNGRYGVYVEEHPKFTDIFVEHYSNIVMTSTTGIAKLTVRAAA